MPRDAHPYRNAAAVLATMHGKERAIAPPLLREIGLSVSAVPGLDTDRLGAFSGEIPRRGTMLEVAVAKARLGMTAAGLPLGLASEGTFGPHPFVPFFPAGIELLVFVDDERGLVIHESLVAEATNFDHLVVSPGDVLTLFLERVGFPSHGLIVRANLGEPQTGLTKGIVDRDLLESAIATAAALSSDGRARIETDMRAHLNPTRMQSLTALAERLGQRLATACPACGAPGWGRVGIVKGLACEQCGAPTEMVAHEVFGCGVCTHRETRSRSDGLRFAPAAHCPECNP